VRTGVVLLFTGVGFAFGNFGNASLLPLRIGIVLGCLGNWLPDLRANFILAGQKIPARGKGVAPLVADVTLCYLTMAESRTGERSSQPEFEAFYLRTSRLLHGYLCRLSRDPATADEVLQEAYVRLINAPEERVRKAYLYRTATNLLRDRWRKQKRERKYWQMENFSEAVYQNLDMPLDVSSVFEKLSALDRATLWLAHVEQLSHREMAAILRMKEKSIKVILFRTRAKARALFEKAGLGVSHHE
jgi:RNA polymerase sigma factor (sigma-70 family)